MQKHQWWQLLLMQHLQRAAHRNISILLWKCTWKMALADAIRSCSWNEGITHTFILSYSIYIYIYIYNGSCTHKVVRYLNIKSLIFIWWSRVGYGRDPQWNNRSSKIWINLSTYAHVCHTCETYIIYYYHHHRHNKTDSKPIKCNCQRLNDDPLYVHMPMQYTNYHGEI